MRTGRQALFVIWRAVARRRGAARATGRGASVAALMLGLALAGAPVLPAAGQQPGGAAQPAARSHNQPGRFDFYLLALSWSPSFCEASAERPPYRPPQQQCGARPFSFVVHGLWPQHEKGFPQSCQVPAPRLPRTIVDSMLDLMPSTRLVFNEWDRHGTCSGLPAQRYFDTVRKARAAVQIPPQYRDLAKPLLVSPAEVESAFMKANPGLGATGIAVVCRGRRLTEVRICMDKDLKFRACDEVDRRACRREQVMMPPVRGG